MIPGQVPWTGDVAPGEVPMDRKRGTWTGSYLRETWYLDKFPWTGIVVLGLVPMDRKRGSWTSSNDSRHGTRTRSNEKETGCLEVVTGQVPTDIRHDTWTSSHGQMAGYLGMFPCTEDVVRCLDKNPCTEDLVWEPGQVPMDRRRSTGTWTSSQL